MTISFLIRDSDHAFDGVFCGAAFRGYSWDRHRPVSHAFAMTVSRTMLSSLCAGHIVFTANSCEQENEFIRIMQAGAAIASAGCAFLSPFLF